MLQVGEQLTTGPTQLSRGRGRGRPKKYFFDRMLPGEQLLLDDAACVAGLLQKVTEAHGFEFVTRVDKKSGRRRVIRVT